MTIYDLEEILRIAQVNPLIYCVNGTREEAICLLPKGFGGEWVIFIQERGRRFDEKVFSSEDEACVAFLKKVFFYVK
ncbi:MAG: hypothetical protein R2715_14225 [Ilumatobacteraceae bacterium]